MNAILLYIINYLKLCIFKKSYSLLLINQFLMNLKYVAKNIIVSNYFRYIEYHIKYIKQI